MNKNHPLYFLDSNEKVIKLADSSFRQVVKIVKDGENLHNVALKEIAYYLIMLKNTSENSTEILLKIYVKYSIEKLSWKEFSAFIKAVQALSFKIESKISSLKTEGQGEHLV